MYLNVLKISFHTNNCFNYIYLNFTRHEMYLNDDFPNYGFKSAHTSYVVYSFFLSINMVCQFIIEHLVYHKIIMRSCFSITFWLAQRMPLRKRASRVYKILLQHWVYIILTESLMLEFYSKLLFVPYERPTTI